MTPLLCCERGAQSRVNGGGGGQHRVKHESSSTTVSHPPSPKVVSLFLNFVKTQCQVDSENLWLLLRRCIHLKAGGKLRIEK